MQLHTWRVIAAVFAALIVESLCLFPNGEQVFAQANEFSREYPSETSLCGENLTKETGTLNNLFYVFYKSSTTTARDTNVPVILWLSGGPGCSGLVALLFENGPCLFDDETNKVSFNPHSWTGLAHVIYIDQPKGTGYSGDNVPPWSLGSAVEDMHTFLEQFFLQHQELRGNDFYIFGESFAGHYVPGLAATLTVGGDRSTSLPKLKGVGIGNGVVSTVAWANSMIPFSKTNDYGLNLLGANAVQIKSNFDHFNSSIGSCRIEASQQAASNLRKTFVATTSTECEEAIHSFKDFYAQANAAIWELGRNVYDMRRPCHIDDPLQLCYRFALLQDFVNSPVVSAYFGERSHEWKLCASEANDNLAKMDRISESQSYVAEVLDRGVRVLVYGGAADTVVNWISQDTWTSDLSWKYGDAFRSAPFIEQNFQGHPIGRVRTAHGLSFMKVYEAGHMVPHDQPAVSYEMVRSFLYDTPGTGMFS